MRICYANTNISSFIILLADPEHPNCSCILLDYDIENEIKNNVGECFLFSAANSLGLDAIFVYTRHGQMASLLSRRRPNPPIFAFTDDNSIRMALNLQWGVTPLLIELSYDMEANTEKTIELIKSKGLIEKGDTVLVVSDIIPSAAATQTVFQSVQVKTVV